MRQHDYTASDIPTALRSVGLAQNDIVYLSTQLFGLGRLLGAEEKNTLCEALYSGIRDAIGPGGTLVVPSFTQQVGRYGVPYFHEKTTSLTGIFGEYIRNLPDSQRSLHPVFSVCAVGPKASHITSDISTVAFGRNSAFDRLYRLGGKAVCIGFEYYSGHITALMHYVETAYAVPYYYTKLVLADVYKGGVKLERHFSINVKYLNIGCKFDFRRYIDELAARGLIRAAKLGRSMVYSVDIQAQIDVGFELLQADIYSFLSSPPNYVAGQIPCDGPPEAGGAAEIANWTGFLIGQ